VICFDIFLHFSRSNQGVFKDYFVFKGFSSAFENEFQIPGVFQEYSRSSRSSTEKIYNVLKNDIQYHIFEQ
jgi:4-alpha-glucanotransferase